MGSEETLEGEIRWISQQEAPHSGEQSRTSLSMIPQSPRSRASDMGEGHVENTTHDPGTVMQDQMVHEMYNLMKMMSEQLHQVVQSQNRLEARVEGQGAAITQLQHGIVHCTMSSPTEVLGNNEQRGTVVSPPIQDELDQEIKQLQQDKTDALRISNETARSLRDALKWRVEASELIVATIRLRSHSPRELEEAINRVRQHRQALDMNTRLTDAGLSGEHQNVPVLPPRGTSAAPP